MFNEFVNCVVFPKKGFIPLTCQISGSDLDGDTFFLCWDKRLLIKELPPNPIDDPNKPKAGSIGSSPAMN